MYHCIALPSDVSLCWSSPSKITSPWEQPFLNLGDVCANSPFSPCSPLASSNVFPCAITEIRFVIESTNLSHRLASRHSLVKCLPLICSTVGNLIISTHFCRGSNIRSISIQVCPIHLRIIIISLVSSLDNVLLESDS